MRTLVVAFVFISHCSKTTIHRTEAVCIILKFTVQKLSLLFMDGLYELLLLRAPIYSLMHQPLLFKQLGFFPSEI